MVKPRGNVKTVKKSNTLPYRRNNETPRQILENSLSYFRMDADRYLKQQRHFLLAIPNEVFNLMRKIRKLETIFNWKTCTYCLGTLIIVLLFLIIIKLVFPYPLHATCTVKWILGDSCNFVIQRFKYQMLKWPTCNNYEHYDGLYMMKDLNRNEENILKAIYTSYKWRTSHSIQITFNNKPDNTCIATAVSRSDWFIIFDDGSNYCNLRKLITTSGLDINPVFTELTNDVICTQYNMAICK